MVDFGKESISFDILTVSDGVVCRRTGLFEKEMFFLNR